MKFTLNFLDNHRLSPKKIACLSTALIIFTGIIVAAFILFSHRYDISRYVTVAELGYDGSGSVAVTVDTEAFLKKCHSDGTLVDVEDLSVTVSVAGNGSLKNGSDAVVELSADGVSFDSVHHTMSKLKKPQIIDIFEKLNVYFVGANNTGKAVLDTDKCDEAVQLGVEFSVIGNENLSNGGTVTVSAKEKGNALKKLGYSPKTTEKSYTVSGLPVYPTSLANIDCSDCRSYFEQQLMRLINKTGVEYPWSFDCDLTAEWNVLGKFKYEFSLAKKSAYYCYNENSLQDNNYSIIYEVTMTAKCTDVFSKPKELKELVKKNNMYKGKVITGTLYFVVSANGVYIDSQGKNLVLPVTDENYNSAYYGRAYTAIDYNTSLYKLQQSIKTDNNYDTVISVK